jgi:S-adenosylmethionine:tRNA ribosyltransferase-isomerase
MTALLTLPASRLEFDLPAALEAHEPPEATGRNRSDVRLLVSPGESQPIHLEFSDIAAVLRPGDLLVVNTSGTMASAVAGTLSDGTQVVVHFSTVLPGGMWLVELRTPELHKSGVRATRPFTSDAVGQTVALSDGVRINVLARYGDSHRLYVSQLCGLNDEPLASYLARVGRPIRYAYVSQDWPLELYQTVFANEPGSAEMPSAARPFTHELVTELISRGIDIAPITLHTGVSSGEVHEAPYPERFDISASTAARVNATHAAGGRVIAIGTTVVRALETTADDRNISHPGSGWTDLVITPERGVRVVDGLLTGWHEPKASHLLMLEAVADIEVLRIAYTEALAAGYRWHEFGDLHLILTK